MIVVKTNLPICCAREVFLSFLTIYLHSLSTVIISALQYYIKYSTTVLKG